VTPKGRALAKRTTQELIAAERAALVTLTPVDSA
jgi:hypothetical protein